MSLAKSYARALYEAAQESKLSAQDMDQVEQQLENVIRGLSTTKDVRVALFGPTTSTKEKMAVVSAIAQQTSASPLVARFLTLLAGKERLAEVGDISAAFSAVRLEAEGGVLGKVESADPMEAADLEGLSRSFSQKLGKKVSFRASTNPSLLAGMKVTVNGVTYDGTLSSQIQRLRDRLVVSTETLH